MSVEKAVHIQIIFIMFILFYVGNLYIHFLNYHVRINVKYIKLLVRSTYTCLCIYQFLALFAINNVKRLVFIYVFPQTLQFSSFP